MCQKAKVFTAALLDAAIVFGTTSMASALRGAANKGPRFSAHGEVDLNRHDGSHYDRNSARASRVLANSIGPNCVGTDFTFEVSPNVRIMACPMLAPPEDPLEVARATERQMVGRDPVGTTAAWVRAAVAGRLASDEGG
jgi:hypothetical protein